MVKYLPMPLAHPSRSLRDLLACGRIVVAPGAFDAWSARLVEAAGFPAVYMTGFGASASILGAPDLGIMSASDMADHAARLAGAIGVPLIADADTGFGEVLNVERTLLEYQRAGVAAIQLEDQVTPKKCGHMENKQVLPLEDFLPKLRAAVAAKRDSDFMIIARTDARAVSGLGEALRRGEAFLEAGADMLFIEAPQSEAEMRKVCETFRGVPLVANMVEAGKTPYRSAEDLEQMGFALAIYPITTLLAATAAMRAALEELRTHGRHAGETPLVTFPEFNALMGLQRFIERVNRFKD
jgi:2-methylisocitrate lyase-like PEP mutase family enzyme